MPMADLDRRAVEKFLGEVDEEKPTNARHCRDVLREAYNSGIRNEVAFKKLALGSLKCTEGDVLGIHLEDNRRRYQRRLRQVLGDGQKPKRLALTSRGDHARRVDSGLIDQIRSWAKSVGHPRLVVVDTLTAIRPVALDKRATFQVEYEIVSKFTALAEELGVAIVIVHHERKASSEALIDMVSGTLGLAAAANTVAALHQRLPLTMPYLSERNRIAFAVLLSCRCPTS